MYNPQTTNTVVRSLVEQDKVFAILNGLGTPTHIGVLPTSSSSRCRTCSWRPAP